MIQRRIDGYRGEVRFNLMAVIRSRRDAIQELITRLEDRRDTLEARLPGAPLLSGAETAADCLMLDVLCGIWDEQSCSSGYGVLAGDLRAVSGPQGSCFPGRQSLVLWCLG